MCPSSYSFFLPISNYIKKSFNSGGLFKKIIMLFLTLLFKKMENKKIYNNKKYYYKNVYCLIQFLTNSKKSIINTQALFKLFK